MVIPESYNDLPVKEIGDYAFLNCEILTSITIPDSVTSIGEGAFFGCSGLTSIEIPDSVTSIGLYAFYGCSSVESITVASGNIVYKSSGNCLIETATKTLIAGCKNSVIPSDGSVTSIGDYAFSDCSSLTSIEIPDSVTSIGSFAFFYCESLTSITIPDSVTSIGEWAFASCTNLIDIYCEAESQPYGWDSHWNYGCDATVHWGVKLEDEPNELDVAIQEIETNLVESDYAEVEWNKIQEAINNAKEFSTAGKSVSEIRAEIEALENAILLNPKKAEFGDLNDDDQITSLDYLFVKRSCFGTYELSDVEVARADINRDGQTNSADYLLVKRIAFGTYKVA